MDSGQNYIAVIDDHDGVRRSLMTVLEFGGYKVTGYGSGGEFLKTGFNEKFDCIVLDLEMPQIGGDKILEQLRNLAVSVPVVVVTGTNDASLLACASGPPVHSLWPKPIGAEELLKFVDLAIADSKQPS